MDISSWILWGFIATLILTMLLAGSQYFRFTRMNLPVILGTMFTANRDQAKAIGFGIHILNGWIFSFFHVAIFESIHVSSWYLGAITGFVHGLLVLSIVLPILPAFHPRMASEYQNPTVFRQLEPPGFLGLHYGIRTPIPIIIAHIVYGIILGTFYHL